MGRGRCALVVFAAVLTTACGGIGHRGHDRPAQQKHVGPAKHRSPSSRPKRTAPIKRRDDKRAKPQAKPREKLDAGGPARDAGAPVFSAPDAGEEIFVP
jgi:hypothetical protein